MYLLRVLLLMLLMVGVIIGLEAESVPRYGKVLLIFSALASTSYLLLSSVI